MFLFSKSDTPAVRAHLNAQAAFLNDMSKSLSRSFQEMCQLNMQLGQTMLEESTIVSHQMLTADRPTDMISATAARAQPAAEKLRAYQQHLSRVAAGSQVELAKVAEQHVHETSRTARALAEQVASSAAEETDRTVRYQEEAMRSFRDPFAHSDAQRGNGGSYQGSMQAADDGAHGSIHIDSATEHGTFKGNAQGPQSSQVQQQSKTGKSAP